ncbi:hypothetical protein [Carnobacterium maltaromaticum]|uniref:hypothetical protein n=1 Tax=Carnobacterium maltaromaticum TaxID=2751 RepID=UPI000307C358|nr:hypothetical protein [Carnobacterium maltaromaticum]
MTQLSFAKTEKEIKKELDFLKQAYVKLNYFGPINMKTVESELARLSAELREIKK